MRSPSYRQGQDSALVPVGMVNAVNHFSFNAIVVGPDLLQHGAVAGYMFGYPTASLRLVMVGFIKTATGLGLH